MDIVTTVYVLEYYFDICYCDIGIGKLYNQFASRFVISYTLQRRNR